MSKLYVISIDGLEAQDLQYLKKLPNFLKILEKAAIVKNVTEVYPTLTYTIHTTMITGQTPDIHGIYHNAAPYLPMAGTNWNVVGYNWKMFSDEIKCPTIIDAANDAGLVTAGVMWPVMGGKKPTHNLAEIWPNQCGSLYDTYKCSCTDSVFDLYFDKYIKTFDWKNSIDTDSYSVKIATDIIKRFNPDLLLEHIIILDYTRHYTGNSSAQTIKALERVDGFVGDILNASKDAGTFDETNFIIVGDHGQIDVQEVFNLNATFVRDGLIELDENGLVSHYLAYSFSNGSSALIVMKNGATKAEKDYVALYLMRLKEQYPQHIERVYTKNQAANEEKLSGDFDFVVEAIEGCVFTNAMQAPTHTTIAENKIKTYKSNHGYHPSKGPKPPFIAFGPNVVEGIEIESGSVLNICPTMLKLTGLSMDNMLADAFPIVKDN